MGVLNKFFFWFFVIILAFLPYGIVMSFALIILYYLIPIISNAQHFAVNEEISKENTKSKKVMDEYSDDTLEKMR